MQCHLRINTTNERLDANSVHQSTIACSIHGHIPQQGIEVEVALSSKDINPLHARTSLGFDLIEEKEHPVGYLVSHLGTWAQCIHPCRARDGVSAAIDVPY